MQVILQILCFSLLVLVMVLPVQASEYQVKPQEKAEPVIRITMVNHAAVDIFQKPEVVWREIKRIYKGGEGFREQGFEVSPLDNKPAAFRGGYHMRMKKDGIIVDERFVHITELDEENMRLSLFADYITPAFNGLAVHASYGLVSIKGGMRFELDAYSQMNIPRPEGLDAREAVAKTAADLEKGAEEYLRQRNQRFKMRLEAMKQ